MQYKRTPLSLGHWPQVPYTGHHTILTPITKRIISQVHLTFKDLIPISFEGYKKIKKAKDDQQATSQNYRDQLQRRRKQVQILRQIRQKYILGNDYTHNNKQNAKSGFGSPDLSRKQSNIGPSKSKLGLSRLYAVTSHQNMAINSTHRIYSRVNTQKQQSNRIHSRKKSKNSHSDYAAIPTSSRQYKSGDVKIKGKHLFGDNTEHKIRKQSKNQIKSRVVEQYDAVPIYNSNVNKKSPNKSPVLNKKRNAQSSKSALKSSRSKQTVQQLLKTMKRWQNIDKKHLKQLNRNGHLSPRQKQRLSRVHFNQKKQIRNQINNLKQRLNSNNT